LLEVKTIYSIIQLGLS